MQTLEEKRTYSREYQRKRRAEKPEEAREKSRKFRDAHPEHARAYSREYQRKWRAENPEASKTAARKHVAKWRAEKPEEAAQYHRDWCKANPGKRRAHERKKKYGITAEQVGIKFALQLGRCELCPQEITDASLQVDHCHSSGGVRGLLCAPCNWGLGNFRDDPARLRAAADYVEKYAMLHSTEGAQSASSG